MIFVFLDDRRYIRCETALEVAIRNGHTEIVRRLIEIRNNTLRCREAGGRTPIFTAMKFKRSEIFKLLLKKNLKKSDRCIRELVLITRDENSTVHEPWTERNFGSGSYIAISSFLSKESRLIRQMTVTEICNHASEALSFTHKVAAKGLINLLLEIEKHFGSSALKL